MSLPTNRDELRERWENGERFEFLLFYGHRPPESGVDESCFSQWFARPFEVDNIQYLTAEHWMMAEKARLFKDNAMLEAILASESPRDAKAFGRKVGGFDPDVWNAHKFEIVCRGNYEKFSQHEDFRDFLVATSSFRSLGEATSPPEDAIVREKIVGYQTASQQSTGVILVEAAGRDVIWGIGLGKNNPKSQNPLTWRGRNLLGFALTQVREQISSERCGGQKCV